MTDDTVRFGLPQIATGQAQKEVTHNEALARIDMLLHPVVETMALAVPPADPAAGRGWIVAAGGSGAWAGRAGQLAVWTDGGWRFATPVAGMLAWVTDSGVHARWTGETWALGHWPVAALVVGGRPVVGAQQPAIATPAGGETVDIQARSAISALLGALRNHGLITT